MTQFDIKHTVVDRFLKYVQVDTQSDPYSETFPSTEKQKNLAKILVGELNDLGLSDVGMDKNGYVYATIPGNTNKDVPAICFCSHMDTSPDSSGTNVKPIIHQQYDGQVISLPDDTSVKIDPSKHPDLQDKTGEDIITASGLTLLGADNKAGVAEIMDAATFLVNHPDIKHGPIKILFTPDEEIGRGVDFLDMERLGADFAYTIDGEKAGSIEDETFSADGAVIKIQGVSAHPGYAKGALESAIKIASDIITALPRYNLTPETTSNKEGFIHPTRIDGKAEKATIEFIVRDFDDDLLAGHGRLLKTVMDDVLKRYPNSTAELTITEQYRNMKNVLDEFPFVVDYALEAITRAGMTAEQGSIRGGTDGSRLSFMGLPCPNIFTGGHAFHSKQEWVSVQDMEKAVKTIIHLAMIWEENGK